MKTEKATHPIHGEGEIIRYSPSKTMCIVKYPAGNGQHYFRTHSIHSITIKD